jgi:Zn-dependent protease
VFGKRIRLFKLLGFEVRVDLSWIIIAVLIVWSLAQGVFPQYFPNLQARTYWIMGALGALGLFASIIFHEMCHSLVARRFGLPMHGITLFIFGGVAEMTEEPPSPKAEFFMAIAGPIASILVGALFLGLSALAGAFAWNELMEGIFNYLMLINFILAGFNLIPAFPLDGGRVLRSALWHWKKNISRATKISSSIGAGFGLLLVFLGVFMFIAGAFIAGIWWFLIGLFIRSASEMSYQRLLMKKGLEGETVEHFMNNRPVSVSSDLTVEQLVNDYIYRYHYRLFPVVEDGHLQSCITTEAVKTLPREEWNSHHLKEIAGPCTPQNTVRPSEDAMQALTLMSKTGNTRLLVVSNEGDLVGIVTLRDLLKFLTLKLDLEEDIDADKILQNTRR